jgi:disulfide bond formation protein DsbB
MADDHSPSAAPLVWPAFLVALAALAGSLWLSMGMHLKACPLCLYQRTFVMAVVGVLGIGLLAGRGSRVVLNLLALPSAVAALGVAAFHVYLEATGKLECPAGVLGIGTAPQQSLAALVVLFLLVFAGAARSGGERKGAATAGAFVLGLLFAAGAIASAPPMPAAPTKAYETPLEVCRPPFDL